MQPRLGPGHIERVAIKLHLTFSIVVATPDARQCARERKYRPFWEMQKEMQTRTRQRDALGVAGALACPVKKKKKKRKKKVIYICLSIYPSGWVHLFCFGSEARISSRLLNKVLKIQLILFQ